ncbi:MAG: RNase adapter RapZ [Candidatus Acidiferrales bacterium]
MAPSHTQQNRQLVILTGLSGSGKGSVLRTFEDLGFYCVDNLPVSFIPSFAELYMAGGGEFDRAVLLMDAREGEQLKRLPDVYRKLRREYPATLVFIEASDLALARRFSETRRPHPMGAEFSISEGIRLERKQMAAIRALSDVVIDTTKFTVHDLRQFIIERFQKAGRKPLLISLMSFGYRFGLPADADLVFDVRFLPNPHFVAKLRPFSGKNARVAKYIRSFKQTGQFLRRIEGLLEYLIPHYIREGKSYLTIAFGCTGGRHRSVMMAEAVSKALAKRGYTTKLEHRDLERPAS